MFSLIIAIVAILLVAALALAVVYYGSSAGSTGVQQAHEAGILNAAGTLQAAVQMYQNDHQGALPPAATASQALLSGNYLATWPNSPGAQWSVANGYAITSTDATSCQQIDAKLGISTVPSCSSTTYTDQVVCCQQ